MSGDQSAFWHLEIIHPDPDAAADYLQEVFGAERAEKDITKGMLESFPDNRCVHVRLGGVIMQLMWPTMGGPESPDYSWQKTYEKEGGPCIHNINLTVPDADRTRDAMVARGSKVEQEFEFNMPAGNAISGYNKAYFVNALKQVGMRFELMQEVPGWTPGVE